MNLPDGVGGVLLDIEGTTTPISFVHDTLFPFARRRLDTACATADAHPDVAEAVARLRTEHAAETEAGAPPFGNGAPYAHWLMDRDRKSTGLKMLQGLLWEKGYRSGELRSAVFDDVPPAFAAWRQAGIRLRIFSSGSVLAQKLLFRHTEHGDLGRFLEGYHDTTTGPKREPAAYRAIAGAFALAPPHILFASDVVPELDAARAAGLHTVLVRRPGNPAVPDHDHSVCRDFA